MNIVLMREERDCHNAAIGTVCQVSYEQASKATGHKDLPRDLESPVFSNPLNMYRALINLGFWKKNITWANIERGEYKADSTIVLLHNPQKPFLSQHWIVLGERNNLEYKCFFGDKIEPKIISQKQFKEYFLKGWPNCAFEVYKANFFRLMWEKLKMLFS